MRTTLKGWLLGVVALLATGTAFTQVNTASTNKTITPKVVDCVPEPAAQAANGFTMVKYALWNKGSDLRPETKQLVPTDKLPAPPPPCSAAANDNCANAIALTVNAACVTGRTCGSLEVGEPTPSCDVTQTASVWYTFVANATTMTVTVDQTGGGCFGTSAVYSGTCGSFTELNCQDNVDPYVHNLTGLTIGNTYYVQVSYGSGGPCGDEMDFCIDVDGVVVPAHCSNGIQDADETGIDCGGVDCSPCGGGCTANEDCSTADALTLSAGGTDTVFVCLTAECNTGASDASYIFSGGCPTTQAYQEVWYTFTATNSYLTAQVTNADFNDVQISVWTSSCNSIYTPTCYVSGTGGAANLTNFLLTIGETYNISISSANDGDGGNFDLCIYDFGDPSACNTGGVLTATPAPDSNAFYPFGYYPPNTTVNFCYTINPYEKIACNWIHGIVPTFGSGWQAFNPATDVTTALVTASTRNPEQNYLWSWYADGVVQLNSPIPYPGGGNAGAGWFFDDLDGNPNDNWGDGGCNGPCQCDAAGSGFTWTVCWNLTTKTSGNCSSQEDLSVSMQTYSDGETGNWGSVGCVSDAPDFSGNTQACCDIIPPIIIGTIHVDTSVLGGATFTIQLNEAVLCGDVDATDFVLNSSSFPLGGTTIVSATPSPACSDWDGNGSTDTDTTTVVTITLSAAPGSGYDDTWYVTVAPTSDIIDCCTNLLINGASGGGDVVILPVELINFTARRNGENTVELQWETASEVNSQSFVVERSVDGVQFQRIAQVAAAGNSNQTLYYNAFDYAPVLGLSYYRLRIIDKDGHEEFTRFIPIRITPNDVVVTVAPNPVEDQFTLSFDLESEENIQFTLMNIAGQEVRKSQIEGTKGLNTFGVNVMDLPKGIYFINMTSNRGVLYNNKVVLD